MESKEVRKKHKSKQCALLPTVVNKKYSGEFNGYSVIITDAEEMRALNTMGTFGKGNLSRNAPMYEREVQILRDRQFNHRKPHFTNKHKPRKVLIVPDSDSDTDDYFTNLKVRYEIDLSGPSETLNLSLEEAYFLTKELDCLNIHDRGSLLTHKDSWRLFGETDEYFVRNYIVYHYCRCRNWVVKPGIKFGGDFVLYKGSPQEYHASYVVVIDVLNEHGKRKEEMNRNDMKIKHLYGLNRVSETAGKELMICQITWPQGLDLNNPDNIRKVSVNEVVMKRWLSEATKEDT